ncbi:aldose epimerase family protein [Knoellia sp. CPCC 206450]|uniref:aldose epimerase family protein n=1 Tax=Knoellia tibetensis TaxID=3404798 RepID=UPI003B43AAF1
MRRNFGTLPSGEAVTAFTLENDRGLQLTVLDLGATLQSLCVPDKRGELVELTLGFDDVGGYLQAGNPYLGATVGRYANRIADASFVLDGTRHDLAANEGPTCLHGGMDGFHARMWSLVDSTPTSVTLQLVSPDGDQSFPGELTVTATYRLEGDSVMLLYEATTDAPTVVSLTNHAYFDLGGPGGGGVDAHSLTVRCDAYLPVDARSLPEGPVASVNGTPLDLTAPAPLRDRVRTGHPQVALVSGIDHTYVLPVSGDRTIAKLEHPGSGRALEVSTDQPSLQVYTGNRLDGSLIGRDGILLRQGDGICLETQQLPDAPNQPQFPSPVLRPGETYRAHTRWTFSNRPGSA